MVVVGIRGTIFTKENTENEIKADYITLQHSSDQIQTHLKFHILLLSDCSVCTDDFYFSGEL